MATVKKNIISTLEKGTALKFLILLVVGVMILVRSFFTFLGIQIVSIHDGANLLMAVSALLWLVARIFDEILKKRGMTAVRWVSVAFAGASCVVFLTRLVQYFSVINGLQLGEYICITVLAGAWTVYLILKTVKFENLKICFWILGIISAITLILILSDNYTVIYNNCVRFSSPNTVFLYVLLEIIALLGEICAPIYIMYEGISGAKKPLKK